MVFLGSSGFGTHSRGWIFEPMSFLLLGSASELLTLQGMVAFRSLEHAGALTTILKWIDCRVHRGYIMALS